MTLKNPFFILVLFNCLICHAAGLSAQTGWEKSFGGAYDDQIRSVQITPDGNILLGGVTASFAGNDVWTSYLVQYDLNGTEQWEHVRDIGGFWDNIIENVAVQPDGTFYSCGGTVVRYSATGDTLWRTNINTEYGNSANRVLGLPDGGALLCGERYYTGLADFVLMRLDANGHKLWSKDYTQSFIWSTGGNVVQTASGDFIAVGTVGIVANGNTDGIIIKTDAMGNELWRILTGDNEKQWLGDIFRLGADSFLITGQGTMPYAPGTPPGSWIELRDGNGNLLWWKPFSSIPGLLGSITQIIRTTDGGYALMGSTNTNESDILLVKTDAAFNILWQKTYGGAKTDYGYDFKQTPDGGFCIAGYTSSFGAIMRDIYVIKTDSLGNSHRNILEGIVAYDQNNDCIVQTPEIPISGAAVAIRGAQDSTLRISGADGYYQSLTGLGDYEIRPSLPYPYWAFCDPVQTVTFSTFGDTIRVDLPVQSTVDCPYLAVDITTSFLQRCDDNTFFVSYANYGTRTAENVLISVQLDSHFVFQSATIPLFSQSQNTYIFKLDSLQVWETGSFQIKAFLDCAALSGQVHCIEAHITPDYLCSPDAIPVSLSTECRANSDPFFPYYVLAFPQNGHPNSCIGAETELKYQLRFWNTSGNSSVNITIFDTLSPYVDRTSLRFGAHSHPYEVAWVAENVLKFSLQNIYLADSLTATSGNIGFINFYVKTIPTVPNGTTLYNNAAIVVDNGTASSGFAIETVVGNAEAVAVPAATIPCDGVHIVLNGDGSSTGADITYQWYSSDGNIVSGQNTLYPEVNAQGNYILLVTNDYGCSATTHVTVSIMDTIPPLVICPNDLLRCFGDDVVLYPAPTATDNCLSPGNTFQLVAGLPSGVAFPSGTTTNIYSYTDAQGNTGTCSFSVTVLDSLSVTLDTLLDDAGQQMNGGIYITVAGGLPPYSFEWWVDGLPFVPIEDLSHVGPGYYTATVADALGCTTQAGPFEVKGSTAINSPDWGRRVVLFPNPTTGRLSVLFPAESIQREIYWAVFDHTGSKVAEQQIRYQNQLEFDFSEWAGGLYLLLIRMQEQQTIRRIIVNR